MRSVLLHRSRAPPGNPAPPSTRPSEADADISARLSRSTLDNLERLSPNVAYKCGTWTSTSDELPFARPSRRLCARRLSHDASGTPPLRGEHGPTHGAASGCGAQSEIGFGANKRGNILQQSQATQKKNVLPFRHFRIKSICAEFAHFTLY